MSAPDHELTILRERVAAKPSDLRLRLELGEALCQRRDYVSAIRELQKAIADSRLRFSAGKLLAEAFEARNMREMAIHARQVFCGGPPENDGSAPAAVPRTPQIPRGPHGSAAQEIPRDEKNA
jgi:protein involved in temperature-dependent protein secretion